MKRLIHTISYNGKYYNELTDEEGKREIKKLAEKLKPLEGEIALHPEGDITIKSSGNVFQTMFPDDLSDKISKLINER